MTSVKESVDLLRIKTDKLLKTEENKILLKDDIWQNETLVLKSGIYLTEELIGKLLKFGIKRVNVDLQNHNQNALSEFPEGMSKTFKASQSALIVEKNVIDAGLIIKYLIDIGFRGGNIFVTKEPSFINRYFGVRKINFVFVDGDLFSKCARCVQKYTALRNTHAFVLLDSANGQEAKKSKVSRVNFIMRPIKEMQFKKMVSSALDQNFLDFWTEDNASIA